MPETGVFTARGYEAIVAVRMPATFRNFAAAYLAARNGNFVVSEEAIVALFQELIDEVCLPAPQDDPPSCDPGGGMRSPDDCHDHEIALV